MIFIHIGLTLMLILGIFAWSTRALAQSREDVRKRLKNLETSAEPARKMGAMCYDMVIASKTIEYVCPLDGEKTVYANNSKGYDQVDSLTETKELLKKLRLLVKDITFALDERALCAKCSPGLTDERRFLTLLVRYSDGRIVRTDRITTDDIRYLIGFFSNGLSYATFFDGQNPLKPCETRLKKLLGEN